MDRDEQARAMRELVNQGWTLQQIAEHHGVSVATVRRRLRSDTTSIEPDSPTGHVSTGAETADMWRLWISGVNQTEIGQRVGISQSAVSERLARYRQALPETERQVYLQRCLDQVDDMQRPLLSLITGPPPPAYSNGRAMKDGNGEPVPDWPVIISAVTGVLRTQERMAKFLGLDAPAKAEVLHVEQATEAAKAAADAAAARLAAAGAVDG